METTVKADLSAKLVSLRKENGLTQMDLAEKLNVSRQAISRWEVGAAVPSTDNLKILCELYGVSVDYLLNDGTNHFDNHMDEQDMDTQDTDTEGPVINGDTAKYVSRLHRIICISTALILVLLAVIISMAVLSRQNEEDQITPIEDMTVVEDDDYPDIIFPFD